VGHGRLEAVGWISSARRNILRQPRPRDSLMLLAALLLLGGVVSGCALQAGGTTAPQPSATPAASTPSPNASASPGAGSSPSASASPGRTPPNAPPTAPAGSVSNAAQAAARVIASDAQFAGVQQLRQDSIGLTRWYEATPIGNGYRVIISIGWGDCQAGCISTHRWEFDVADDGTIGKPVESGQPLPPQVTPLPIGGDTTLSIALTAGPVCPVETNPPNPNCSPRPVADATVVVQDPTGGTITELTSDSSGMAETTLPPGTYVVEAMPNQGVMGTPEATAISLTGAGPVSLQFQYDTGIR
jgi:hypothetical protein